MKNYANLGIVRQQKRNSCTKYDLMREEHCAGLARDLKNKYILKVPTKNSLTKFYTSNMSVSLCWIRMEIICTSETACKWEYVPDYRPCWEWGSNRKTSSAARHDTVYIRGGCGRGVGCLEVSDEGGGGLFTFRLAASGIIPRQIIHNQPYL